MIIKLPDAAAFSWKNTFMQYQFFCGD